MLSVLCLVLVGCLNTMVGFSRQKRVEALPTAADVVPFLRALPGVTDVRVYTGEVRSNLDHWLGLNKGFQEEITVTYRESTFHISFDHRGAKKMLMVWAVDDRSRALEVKMRMAEVMGLLRHEFPVLPPWEEMTETSMATGG